MEKLYSPRDIWRLFGFTRRRIRYWEKIGFITPSIRIGLLKYYTPQDLVAFRTAKGLLEAGISFQKVRRTVIDAKRILSFGENTPFSLIICGDRVSGMFGSMSVPFNAHIYFPIGCYKGDFTSGMPCTNMHYRWNRSPRSRKTGILLQKKLIF